MRHNKAEVLLILPSFSGEKHYGKLSKVAPSLIPVSLVYLAAYLEKEGISVHILDGQVEPFTEKELLERVREVEPKIVGITCNTPMFYEANLVASIIKRNFQDKYIVLGGAHPTVLPEEVLGNPAVDFVVRNEGEITFTELVRALLDGNDFKAIKGLSFRTNGEVRHNPPRPFIENLDEIPFPAIHLVPLEKYHQIPDAVFRTPVRCILTSRGCPYECIFCSARQLSGYRYRYRSPENVLEEIDLLINKYYARQILVLDDNFVVNRKRTIEICKGMVERGYHKKVVWTAAGRADQVDEELLSWMSKAGCVLISYGIETGTQRLLDIIDKSLKLETIKRAVEMAKNAGIKVRGTFILGLPTETKEESLRTISFAKGLGLDFAKFSLATPYPGTKLYKLAKEQGLLNNGDWSKFSSMAGFSSYDPVFIPEGRDPKELKSLQKRATREFYLRPKQVFHLIKNTRSFRDLKLYLEVAKSLLRG